MANSDIKDRIARKYAQAVLNYYDISYTVAQQCDNVGSYFAQHPTSAFFLRLSSIKGHDKINTILRITQEQFTSDAYTISVLQAVLKLIHQDGRLPIFMRVCRMIYQEYQKRHNVESCIVMTSHAIDTQKLQPIIAWLEAQVEKTLDPAYVVNQELIAGIRVRGETFFWEESIARTIQTMKQKAHTWWGIS